MKYLGVNLVRHVHDLYDEKYKKLVRKIKDLNKWRDILYTEHSRYQLSPNWSTDIKQFQSKFQKVSRLIDKADSKS